MCEATGASNRPWGETELLLRTTTGVSKSGFRDCRDGLKTGAALLLIFVASRFGYHYLGADFDASPLFRYLAVLGQRLALL